MIGLIRGFLCFIGWHTGRNPECGKCWDIYLSEPREYDPDEPDRWVPWP